MTLLGVKKKGMRRRVDLSSKGKKTISKKKTKTKKKKKRNRKKSTTVQLDESENLGRGFYYLS